MRRLLLTVLWRQMCLCQRTPVSDVEFWLEWLIVCSLVSEAVVCPRAQWIEVLLYLIVLCEKSNKDVISYVILCFYVFLFVIFLSVHLRSYSYGHLLAIKATKHTVNKVKDRTDCSLFFPKFLWYRSNILVVNSFGHSDRAVIGPRLTAQHVPYWIKCPVAALHSC